MVTPLNFLLLILRDVLPFTRSSGQYVSQNSTGVDRYDRITYLHHFDVDRVTLKQVRVSSRDPRPFQGPRNGLKLQEPEATSS
jgi:hypothetical protein